MRKKFRIYLALVMVFLLSFGTSIVTLAESKKPSSNVVNAGNVPNTQIHLHIDSGLEYISSIKVEYDTNGNGIFDAGDGLITLVPKSKNSPEFYSSDNNDYVSDRILNFEVYHIGSDNYEDRIPASNGEEGNGTINYRISVSAHPSILIEKTANIAQASVGDTITYTIKVTNTGDVGLTNVKVTDNLIPNLAGAIVGDLAKGVSVTLTGTYVVPLSKAGTTAVNTANVEGYYNTQKVTGTDSANTAIGAVHPSIDITKTADRSKAKVGDKINYTITVTNTGDVDLTGVEVIDNLISLSGTHIGDLARGAIVTLTGSYVVPDGQKAGDTISNTASVTGNCGQQHVNDTASVTVTVYEDPVLHPSISIVKTADKTEAQVGQKINYTIIVTNNGDVNLSGVTVIDDHIPVLAGPAIDSLDHGESVTLTGSYVVTGEDGNSVENTATVTGNYEGTVVTDSDSVTTPVVHPSIDITKTADKSEAKVGDIIKYTIVVTNTGDVELTGITVIDDHIPNLAGANISSLAHGASVTLTGNYAVTGEDGNSVVNTASVTGNYKGTEVTDNDSVTTSVVHPSISIVKTADKTEAQVGQKINYTIIVTNNGDVDLTGITVTDDHIPNLAGANISSLAHGASVTLTGSYAVTGEDGNSVVNKASVTGNYKGTEVIDNDSVTTPVVHPSIKIEKTADKSEAKVGDTINYTIKVTNTGDVDLTGITVIDDHISDLAGAAISSLAHGASVTLRGSYVVTGQDGNSIVNKASVTGNYKETEVTDNDSVTTPVVHPSIKIEKTADKNEADVGDTITYTIKVTNTGDVDLTGVKVTDDLIDLTGGEIGNLPKGASVTLTGTYVVPDDKSGDEVINNANVVGYYEGYKLSGTATFTVTINEEIPEEPVPGGPTNLPKTGEIPPAIFYGLGLGLAALGVYLRRKK